VRRINGAAPSGSLFHFKQLSPGKTGVKSTLSLNQLKNLRNGGNDLLAVLVDGELHYRALDRRVQALVPGSILARRPKRPLTRRKNGHGKAIAVAKE